VGIKISFLLNTKNQYNQSSINMSTPNNNHDNNTNKIIDTNNIETTKLHPTIERKSQSGYKKLLSSKRKIYDKNGELYDSEEERRFKSKMYCDAYISDNDEKIITVDNLDFFDLFNPEKDAEEDLFLFIPDNKNHKSMILSKPIIDEPPIPLTETNKKPNNLSN